MVNYMQLSPLTTLESSYEALNVKKFDGTILCHFLALMKFFYTSDFLCWSFFNGRFHISVAFTVDPLYHQTSAQFDEGGAKGLLLNNLGVYGGCHVLFDSFESPEKHILSEPHNCSSEVIDLSFAKGTNTLVNKSSSCILCVKI